MYIFFCVEYIKLIAVSMQPCAHHDDKAVGSSKKV